MEALEKLFGSRGRVRILRTFLLNPDGVFENSDMVSKSKLGSSTVRKEINILQSAGVVKKRSFFKETKAKRKGVKPKKKRVNGWQLDENFLFLGPLKNLLMDTGSVERSDLVGKFKRCGSIKLILLSGIFINESDSRVDILVVGDKLKKSSLERAFRAIESEVGKDLSYAFLSTNDFLYRVGVCDRFVRDILDYPHEKIVDKIKIS